MMAQESAPLQSNEALPPTQKPTKPFYKRTKFRLIVGLILFLVTTTAVLVGTWPHWIRNTYRVTVTDKQRTLQGQDSMYLVFTKEANGKVRVFKNVDSKMELKWNSSDLQGELEIGKTYMVKSYGIRFPFTSSYQNIVSVNEVAP